MEKKISNDSNPEDFFYRRLRNLAEEVEEEKKNLHELTKRYYDLLGILENDVSRKIRLRWEGATGFMTKDTQEEWVLIHIDFRRVDLILIHVCTLINLRPYLTDLTLLAYPLLLPKL